MSAYLFRDDHLRTKHNDYICLLWFLTGVPVYLPELEVSIFCRGSQHSAIRGEREVAHRLGEERRK